MKNKYVIIIVLCLIIIPLSYFGITGYLSDRESQTFYDSIKNISDMENQSDIKYHEYTKQNTHSNDEIIKTHNDAINNLSNEVLLLQELKQKLTNETYKEYVDLQINRLDCECKYDSLIIEGIKIDDQYKNGEISLSKRNQLINTKESELSSYGNKTTEYKIESDTFLSRHTDIKNKFNQLNIDEDFLIAQLE